jgi:hypothetical protein
MVAACLAVTIALEALHVHGLVSRTSSSVVHASSRAAPIASYLLLFKVRGLTVGSGLSGTIAWRDRTRHLDVETVLRSIRTHWSLRDDQLELAAGLFVIANGEISRRYRTQGQEALNLCIMRSKRGGHRSLLCRDAGLGLPNCVLNAEIAGDSTYVWPLILEQGSFLIAMKLPRMNAKTSRSKGFENDQVAFWADFRRHYREGILDFKSDTSGEPGGCSALMQPWTPQSIR